MLVGFVDVQQPSCINQLAQPQIIISRQARADCVPTVHFNAAQVVWVAEHDRDSLLRTDGQSSLRKAKGPTLNGSLSIVVTRHQSSQE